MPRNTQTASFAYRSRLLVFTGMCFISLAIWGTALLSSFTLALRDEQYTHLLLILPLSITLIWLDWKPPHSEARNSAWPGALLLLAAGLARIAAWLQISRLPEDQRLFIAMTGLVIWWIGAFLICFGVPALRRVLFPLCFLFWIVPLPEVMLNPIIRLLQQGSVESGRLLFAMFGVPVAQFGRQLTIPGLTIEVARECSSIRSSLMLLVTTMVVAQMTLRSRWRKSAIIASAVPLSIAKNGLRIFVLGILTTRVDHSFISGRLHHEGGILYFAIALAVIILLIWIARRSEVQSEVLTTEPELVESASALH